MLKQLIKQSSGWLHIKLPLHTRFLFLIVSIMCFSVLGETIGTTLLLSKAGAKHLLLCHMLIGLLSIPVHTVFSQLVQRFSHLKLFNYLLVGTILLALLLRCAIALDILPVYYLVFIGFYFQWLLLLDIMFPSLVSDYFTVLDWKRYTHSLAMARAVGGLLGGSLTSLLAAYLITENMLLVIPFLAAATIAQIISLKRFKNSLVSSAQEETGKQPENSLQFHKLLKRYPIILFLSTDIFLLVILLTLAEFQYFSIYSQSFLNEQKLTRFLGIMNVINYTLQFFIPYFFTRPLIQRLGVRAMNLVYAIATLVGFLGLAVNFHLPAAIFLHLNSDSLNGGINNPVQILNYNAIPHRFMAQVRSLNEGLFSCFGRAFAGGGLWLCSSLLTPFQITQISIFLSFVFLSVRYTIGKSYLQSLLTMLNSISINLDEVNKGSKVRLSTAMAIAIATSGEQNLSSDDRDYLKLSPNKQKKGVLKTALSLIKKVRTKSADDILFDSLLPDFQEFACSWRWKQEIPQNEPSFRFLAIAIADYHQRLLNRVLHILSCLGHSGLVNAVKVLLLTTDKRGQANAVEALISLRQRRIVQPLMPLLQQWASSETPEKYIPLSSRRGKIKERRSLQEALQSKERWIQIGATIALVSSSDTSIKSLEMEALIKSSDSLVREVANSIFFTHSEPAIFAKILAFSKNEMPQFLPQIDWLNALLLLDTVSLFRHFSLDEILSMAAYLEPEQFTAGETIFTEGSLGQHLYIIIAGTVQIVEFFNNQIIELSQLKDGQHFGETALFDELPRSAGALAVTDCTLLKLEKNYCIRLIAQKPQIGLEIGKSLSQSLRERNEFFQLKTRRDRVQIESNILYNYVGFDLDNVNFLNNLSQDERQAIAKALEQQEFLAGETIFTEGSLGQHLYTIESGMVRIVKHINNQPQELTRLGVGQHFGEMAMFDDLPRSAGAFAVTDCTLLLLEKKRLLSLIIQRSQIVIKFCKYLSKSLRETDHLEL